MKEKVARILNLAKSATAKNTYLVFIGNSAAGFFGMVAMILVSRSLGPEAFGVFSIAFALSTLLQKIGDLGLNFAMVKDISQSRARKQPEKIEKIFLTAFWMKVGIVLLIIFPIFILRNFISIKLFNSWQSVQANSLVIGFFFLDIFYDHVRVYFEANKRFLESIMMYVIANALKIISILAAIIFFTSFKQYIVIYIFAPFVAAILFFPRTKINLRWAFFPGELKCLLKFSSWMAVSVLFAAIGENLNIFMVSSKLTPFETGIYSAAEKFIMPFYIFAAAMGTVFISRTSEFLDINHIKSFVKKVMMLQIALLLLCGLIFPLTVFLPVLLGTSYQPSVIILQILLIANYFRIAITPLNSVFYPLNKPVIFAINSITQVVILFVLNQRLITMFQGRGAAFSLLVTNIVIFITNYIFLYFILKKHEQRTVHLG